MAFRSVFLPCNVSPYFAAEDINFCWYPGQSICQKQKNVQALHTAFLSRFPGKRVLEISTKSLQPEGVSLSAFNLRLHGIELEKTYQASKQFEHGGPFPDILLAPASKAAKKDSRLLTSGQLLGYIYNGRHYPPDAMFYNWLYINALLQNTELAKPLLFYDGFTDIEYDPAGMNCQARAAAIYVSLFRCGLLDLDVVHDFDHFRSLFSSACAERSVLP